MYVDMCLAVTNHDLYYGKRYRGPVRNLLCSMQMYLLRVVALCLVLLKANVRTIYLLSKHIQKYIQSTITDEYVTHLNYPNSSFQLLSLAQLFVNPWTAACQPSLSITKSRSLLKSMSIELVMPFNHLILSHPLLLLPSVFPSTRVFADKSALHIRWPKFQSFSFSISPSNEHPGLISFRMHWLDFLAVQGTLKSGLQYHSSKASILQCSAFFIVQLLHPYMTTG